MARALDRMNDAHIASPWAATAVRARCVEPEGDPTEVIPAALLLRLLAETARDGRADGGAPRFEIVDMDPEGVTLDESAFENAFEQMLGTGTSG